MRKVLVGLLAMLVAGSILYAQKPDPSMGTWKLNLAKSKFSPDPPPKNMTAKMEPAGGSLKISVEGTDAEGKPTGWQVTAKYDGKDYPVTGSPAFDTYTLKRVNATTAQSTHKKGGKVVFNNKRVLSKDGKVMTVTQTGTNPQGKPVKNVLVFDRQ